MHVYEIVGNAEGRTDKSQEQKEKAGINQFNSFKHLLLKSNMPSHFSEEITPFIL